MDNSYLALEPRNETGLEQVLGTSITYRIANGPQQGRKAFTLQTLPPQGSLEEISAQVAQGRSWPTADGQATCAGLRPLKGSNRPIAVIKV